MDIILLQEALQNENNLSIINTNIQEISKHKNDLLQQLGLKKNFFDVTFHSVDDKISKNNINLTLFFIFGLHAVNTALDVIW